MIKIRAHVPVMMKPALDAPNKEPRKPIRRPAFPKRAWVEWEKELLRKCYPTTGGAGLVDALKRSPHSIGVMAAKMGITGPGSGRVLNSDRAAREALVRSCLQGSGG